MEKKTYPSGVITPELGSTNWYSDYDTNSSLLDSNITKTNSLDSKVKELETSYTNVETSLTSLSAVAKSGDYNDLSNKPESIALAEKAVADGDNNVITKTYATKKDVVTSLEPYIKKTELADVATSGSYTDLSDKPTTIAHADRSTADNNGDVITETYAKKTEIPNLDGYALSKDISKVGKTNNYKDLDNLPTIPSLDGYVTDVELSPVAKSGDYNDLSNTPEPVDLTPYATKKELGSKADDANVVHKSGTETIVGTKTFSSQIKGDISGSSTSCTGNSASATKLATARTISLTGAVTGSVSFDGSANASISTTLSNIDASKITSGTIDIARIPKAALAELKIVADDDARFALTTADIQNGDTVKVESTGKMYYVKDQTKLSTEDGYAVYTTDQASSVDWSGVINKPTTFTPSSHTHGKITNDGKIGTDDNKPLITTTGGVVTTGSFGTAANTFCQGNDSRLSDARTPKAHTHAKSDITDFPTLATVATSGSYTDLSNKPTIPTVNNATLTIQKNGTTVKTFTANASANVTANITVPTKTSELTNNSGYITSSGSCNYANSAGIADYASRSTNNGAFYISGYKIYVG